MLGAIPTQLEDLHELRKIFLRDNEYSGCVPSSLRDVRYHDVGLLNLPRCASWPRGSQPSNVSTCRAQRPLEQ